MRHFRSLILSSTFALLAIPLTATPVIQYQTTFIGSVGPGQNQYQFDYTVSGYTFLTNQDFVIHFNPAEYQSLTAGVANPTLDWDLLVTQPDKLLPADGTFDSLALVDSPSLAGPFRVKAVFLGNGSPGSQFFEIDQFDSSGQFQQQIATGQTTPGSVTGAPETGTLMLIPIGLGMLAINRFRCNVRRSSRFN